MPAIFSLCASCTALFQALRFDADARCRSCLLPFGSIVWSDELPRDERREFLSHRECNHSLIRLFSARKQLWQTGHHSDWSQQVLSSAQQLLPDWPGFRRLNLSAEHQAALQACEEETEEIMDTMRKDAAVSTLTDHGSGVVSFTAHPHQPQQNQ